MRHVLSAALLFACAAGACAQGPAHSDAASPSPAPRHAPEPYVQLTHPDWSRDAVIYQINTRQFTPEGTFAAARAHLPRLAELGVDILWLMPIHPIGEVNRKGSLGSPYAVKDYYGVNPEFGTLADLETFIDEAQGLGMKVILDWVANHTAWDNPLTETHPGWYERDWKGDLQPTVGTDWDDIIELDFASPEMRAYMAGAMAYWVREVGVDGFRCDVAGMVPLDFWEDVRAELDAIKPVFMLAEWETRDLHANAFDATYAWGWKDAMQAVARGEAGAGALKGYYASQINAWPQDAYRMVYTANHDQNAWDGVASEIYGPAYDAAIVLSFVGEGIPLIYNGQEAGLDKQLAFFERDPIDWRPHPHADLFRALTALKTETRALWNGAAGARMTFVETSEPERVFAFVRAGEDDAVLAVFNLSDVPVRVDLVDGPFAGRYRDAFTREPAEVVAGTTLDLGAWDYRVLVAGD